MKVGILSDTHIRKGRSLPFFVWDALADVDTILHAGDIVTQSILEELQMVAPVIGVRGNCDWWVEGLPEKAVFQLDYLKIGMTHGYQGIGNNTPERAYNTFNDDKVDLIIFGHSHIPFNSLVNGIMLFNPGSPTEKRAQSHASLGILSIEDGKFDIQHLFF